MKFYQGLLPRIIWDPSKNETLVEFGTDRTFETEDENLIKLLRGKGYLLDRDMAELERTGTLPHGGFEKVIEDGDLPSGRASVEDESSVHGAKPQVRARKMPATEAQDLVTDEKTEPSMKISNDEEVKSKSKSKPKRQIKRRK
jgi:hypothetical protein